MAVDLHRRLRDALEAEGVAPAAAQAIADDLPDFSLQATGANVQAVIDGATRVLTAAGVDREVQTRVIRVMLGAGAP